MRYIVYTLILVSFFSSCIKNTSRVWLYEYDQDRMTYSECLDTITNLKESDYDIYLSLQHGEELKTNCVNLVVNLSSNRYSVNDTIRMVLANPQGNWIGTQKIGNYTIKQKCCKNLNFNPLDTIIISLRPLMPKYPIDDIKWVAVEFRKSDE